MYVRPKLSTDCTKLNNLYFYVFVSVRIRFEWKKASVIHRTGLMKDLFR